MAVWMRMASIGLYIWVLGSLVSGRRCVIEGWLNATAHGMAFPDHAHMNIPLYLVFVVKCPTPALSATVLVLSAIVVINSATFWNHECLVKSLSFISFLAPVVLSWEQKINLRHLPQTLRFSCYNSLCSTVTLKQQIHRLFVLGTPGIRGKRVRVPS